MSTRRGRLAANLAAKRQCPKCQRKSALHVIVNPGTASTVCRWCDYESTTVTA